MSVKRSHPNYQEVNKLLVEFYLKVQTAILKLQSRDEFSFANLKGELNGKPLVQKQFERSVTFNEYTQQLVGELLSINKSGNAIIYRTASNRLIKFAGSDKLQFKEIDYSLLEGFKRCLVKDDSKQNTISNYLRTIRAIFNRAIKAKLVDKSYYP